MYYKLNEKGKKVVAAYISELEAKKKEILDAKLDTADETYIPTIDDIENDINWDGLNGDCEYCNSWAVTDHYDSDYPLILALDKELEGSERR